MGLGNEALKCIHFARNHYEPSGQVLLTDISLRPGCDKTMENDVPCTGESSRPSPEGLATGRPAVLQVMGLSIVRLPRLTPDRVDEVLLIAEEAEGVVAA